MSFTPSIFGCLLEFRQWRYAWPRTNCYTPCNRDSRSFVIAKQQMSSYLSFERHRAICHKSDSNESRGRANGDCNFLILQFSDTSAFLNLDSRQIEKVEFTSNDHFYFTPDTSSLVHSSGYSFCYNVPCEEHRLAWRGTQESRGKVWLMTSRTHRSKEPQQEQQHCTSHETSTTLSKDDFDPDVLHLTLSQMLPGSTQAVGGAMFF